MFSGAAKVTSLLLASISRHGGYLCTTNYKFGTQGIEPKVMVVEEAGQVLESHILASLVQSVQHLVMIGDPLQLRPSVNSYSMFCFKPVVSIILMIHT